MLTNSEMILVWGDSRLTWDPDDYGGIKIIRQPYESVWAPDILLYNR